MMPLRNRLTGVNLLNCHIYYLSVVIIIFSITTVVCNVEHNLNKNIIKFSNYSQNEENLIKLRNLENITPNDVILTINRTLLEKENEKRKEEKEDESNLNKINELEIILFDYLNQSLSHQNSYEIMSGIELIQDKNKTNNYKRNRKSRSYLNNKILNVDEEIIDSLKEFAETHIININVPRAVESGRLFFFKGLKKLMYPMFLGVQIAKTILFVLFLPSIVGSLGKIVGKGLSGISGFSNQPEAVEDLDFKDNPYNAEQDNHFNANEYAYPAGTDEATNNMATKMYDSAAAATNNVISRYGPGGQKITYINGGGHNYFNKYTNSQMGMHRNDFKVFHDIPASSLLLSNYDPFYSPLLSRLDSVFQQLGYGMSNQEKCREKLVCLMYANPAKFAPYSNLISAQLSRELNELRKPTSDNPDILRFFKYMRAAKDGQDNVNCDAAFKECTTLKDSNNPVMITTYNDINKLVFARKFT